LETKKSLLNITVYNNCRIVCHSRFLSLLLVRSPSEKNDSGQARMTISGQAGMTENCCVCGIFYVVKNNS